MIARWKRLICGRLIRRERKPAMPMADHEIRVLTPEERAAKRAQQGS